MHNDFCSCTIDPSQCHGLLCKMKYVTPWFVFPHAQKLRSGNAVILLCFTENVSRSGSRSSAVFKRVMLLLSMNTPLRRMNSMPYMLSRDVILFFERRIAFKVVDTCLISFGTMVSPAFSIMSDVRATTSGARCISSYSPSKLLSVKSVKFCPTVFNSGAFCKLCEEMCNLPSSARPSNALGCTSSSELTEI